MYRCYFGRSGHIVMGESLDMKILEDTIVANPTVSTEQWDFGECQYRLKTESVSSELH